MLTAKLNQPKMMVTHNGAAVYLYTTAQASAIVKSEHAATPGSRLGNHAFYKDVYVKLTAEESAARIGAEGALYTERAAFSMRKLYTDSAIVKAHPETCGMWIVTKGGR